MNITPTEAEEALEAIRVVTRKTRRAISNSGAYTFLILWGVIWMVGFLNSQFLPVDRAGTVWLGLDFLGGILSVILGIRISRGVQGIAPPTTGKRIGLFWLLLFLYCFAAIMVAQPVDGKQLAMFIILFVTVGWIAMGLLLSFTSFWWGLAMTVMALFGYFLLPGFFFLWMAFLGGGGMVALGLYIRYRW